MEQQWFPARKWIQLEQKSSQRRLFELEVLLLAQELLTRVFLSKQERE
jgi:hypothetical protein